jgi:hypothetical protein
MHRVAALFPGDGDYLTDIQIWRRARSGQGDRFIDASNMKGARIVLGIDANRPDAHFGRGASDADGNFAAVRDQERFYAHRRHSHPAFTSLSDIWQAARGAICQMPDVLSRGASGSGHDSK